MVVVFESIVGVHGNPLVARCRAGDATPALGCGRFMSYDMYMHHDMHS
jgi:hypothetical protein